ncbi:MAG TPA: aminotransferase class IV [Planctomycetota bacterium]
MSEVWLDGDYLPEEKALLPATDATFLQGRGVFETIRAYDGFPFRMADHLIRLAITASKIGIPWSRPNLAPVVPELCRRNGVSDAAIRITVTAGGQVLVTARERRPVPEAWITQGAEVTIAPWRRDPRSPLAGHKTTSYLENVLIHDEAQRRGCVDALFVGTKGELLEGAVSNIFLVIGGNLTTPRLNPGVLPGITRWTIMELMQTKERTVKIKELWKAEEAFLTNSLMEIVPILKPPGPVTRGVMKAYEVRVNESLRQAQ